MRHPLHLLFVLTLLVAPRAGAALDEPGRGADVPDAALRYRTDAIVLQLAPPASRALAARAASVSGRTPRAAALGIASIDRVAADLGGARFEREFPGEPAPGPFADSAPGATDLSAFYLVHLPPGTDRDRALAAFRATPDVAHADPIARVTVEVIPNDSLWSKAWHLYQPSRRDIHAPEAWDLCRGDSSIVVAILDTGVLLDHPDLRERLWHNAAERAGFPGVDDDANGFVDDRVGWDFVALDSAGEVVAGEDWRDEDDDPNDFTAHGTAVAGLVAASSDNGIGVTSTAWNVRLMPLRVGYSARLAPSGWIDLAWAARAMLYAARNGASVIDASFASTMQADLAAAADEATRAGVTIVVAAGNGQPAHYLADRGDGIGVTATDENDRLPQWANRGPYVTLAAPGVNLPSTLLTRPGTDSLGLRQPSYTVFATGTSFAAPLVAGAAALLQSDRKSRGLRPLTPYEVQLRLAETADDIAAQNPGVSGFGTGRLNLQRALADPPGSFAMPSPSPSVGPGVRLPTLAPPTRFAFATAAGQLLLVDAAREGALSTVPLSGAPQGGVAAADMGDGSGTCLFVATRASTIDGFSGSGQPLPGWPVGISGSSPDYPGEPALGDLDGDGVLEVVWGGSDGTVRAWHADGSPVAGFPRTLGGRYTAVYVALGDLDGEPGVEIAATLATGQTWLLRADGTTLPGWPVAGDYGPFAPVIVRLGAAAKPAVVIAFSTVVIGYDVSGNAVLSGSALGYESLPPVAADLDGDGGDELILVRHSPASVVVMDSLGRVHDTWNTGAELEPLPDGAVLVGGSQATPILLLRAWGGGLLAFTPEGARIDGFPKAGGAGDSPGIYEAVRRPDADTFIAAGSGDDASLFFYRGWPSSPQFPNRHPWPTARGNDARTGCTYYTPPLAIVDNQPPSAVSDLAAGATGPHRATLHWSAPADEGPTGRPRRYDLRWSSAPIDAANFDAAQAVPSPPLPAAPGDQQAAVATNLAENATLYFALRSLDAAGNASAVSNVASAVTSAAPPAAVTDLRVSAWTNTSVTLRWRATGDDGASGRPARYRVHAALAPIDASSFEAAPIRVDVAASTDAGGDESVTLAGLAAGRRHWIALAANDASGLASPLSNVVSTVLGPLATHAGLALAPRLRPSAAPVELFWQGAASASGEREIRIYDLAGRRVRTLPLGAGDDGVARWDGRDGDGHRLRAGLYFATLTVSGATARSRIVLVE